MGGKKIGMGYMAIVPSSSQHKVVLSGGRCRSESFEKQNTTKTHKVVLSGGGCRSESFEKQNTTKTHKVVLSGGRGRSESFEKQNATKALCKNHGGGCTSKTSQSHKAGGFVEKRNGNHGFKQELKYNNSLRIDDKVKGCTTEYETQVKFKKVTTYHNNNSSSKKICGGGGYKAMTIMKKIDY